MKQLLIYKKYEDLVPILPDEDYQVLKESIKNNGLWMPIVVNQKGHVLDGHHRLKICQELGIKPKFTIKNFSSKDEEIIFVGEVNLKRRQLTILQRIEIVQRLKPYYVSLAKKNLSKGGKGLQISAKVNTRKKLSEKAKTSHNTYDKGIQILEKASKDDIEKINKGIKTITKVYREIKKTEKKNKRNQQLKKLQVKLPKTITLHNKAFQKLKIKSGSISLIFTDPPYHDKYLNLYKDLAIQASDVLRDGGSLVCYVGQGNIGKVINFMEAQGLKFHWPITVLHSGASASVFGKKVLVAAKIMLWFVKGKYEGEFVRDVIKSEFEGKELHEWAQSTKESDYYIKYMTIKNEIVYDPFLGSGTFGISAKKLNRQFIGCEIDKNHFETSRRLISNAKT